MQETQFDPWVGKIPWRRAWKIPWTEEPGGLQSMGLQSQTQLSNFTFTFTLAIYGQEPAFSILNPLRAHCLERGEKATVADGVMATTSFATDTAGSILCPQSPSPISKPDLPIQLDPKRCATGQSDRSLGS